MPKHQQKQPEWKVALNVEVDGRSISYTVNLDIDPDPSVTAEAKRRLTERY